MVADQRKQLACDAEWLFSGFGVSEGAKGAAVSEAGVGVFGDDPQLLPASGCFGAEAGGLGVVTLGLRWLGRQRAECTARSAR